MDNTRSPECDGIPVAHSVPSDASADSIEPMTFVVAEAVIGIVSFATGLLSIPPLIGVGTLVDAAILVAGLVFAPVRSLRRNPAA